MARNRTSTVAPCDGDFPRSGSGGVEVVVRGGVAVDGGGLEG